MTAGLPPPPPPPPSAAAVGLGAGQQDSRTGRGERPLSRERGSSAAAAAPRSAAPRERPPGAARTAGGDHVPTTFDLILYAFKRAKQLS